MCHLSPSNQGSQPGVMRVRVEWEYDMESHCHLQSGNSARQLQRKKVFEIQKCKMVKIRPNQDPCIAVMRPATYVFGTICSVGQLNDALFTKLVGKAGCREK